MDIHVCRLTDRLPTHFNARALKLVNTIKLFENRERNLQITAVMQ